MSTVVLGGAVASAESAGRICDDILDAFESEDAVDRASAVKLCSGCPLLHACRQQTRIEILDDRGPCGVVRAGVAWDYDGRPDAEIHTDRVALAWLPDSAIAAMDATTETPESDWVDETVVDLAFSDPSLLNGREFSPAESDAIILRGAALGRSMNFLSSLLAVHYRVINRTAIRLGVRDSFGRKPKRVKPVEVIEELVVAPVEPIDLDALTTAAATQPSTGSPLHDPVDGQLEFDFPAPDPAPEPTAPLARTTGEPQPRKLRAVLRRVTDRRPRRFRVGLFDVTQLIRSRSDTGVATPISSAPQHHPVHHAEHPKPLHAGNPKRMRSATMLGSGAHCHGASPPAFPRSPIPGAPARSTTGADPPCSPSVLIGTSVGFTGSFDGP